MGGVAPPAGHVNMSDSSPANKPGAQTYGQQRDPAADFQREVASAAARQAGQQAANKTLAGLTEIKGYIQENPTSVKVLCFFTGLVLMVFSSLGLFNIFGAAFEPKQYLTNVYNVFFGFLICVCDGKESWMKSCFDIQEKVFRYAYFLATQTGRAIFYIYIGSMTLLVLPDNWFWKVIYIIIGGVLCLLAMLMLIINWCGRFCGCDRSYSSSSAAGLQ